VLGAAGLVGAGNALVAVLCVVACAAIFGFGETMLSPVMPALTNALASDELRGRYNAMSSMIFWDQWGDRSCHRRSAHRRGRRHDVDSSGYRWLPRGLAAGVVVAAAAIPGAGRSSGGVRHG
jgi:hypothetical protein